MDAIYPRPDASGRAHARYWRVNSDAQHRPIRSFVLRQGRFSPAQREAYDTLLPRFGIPYAPTPIDLGQVFGRANPKTLEIGFGMGETTAAIAALQPDRDFLAIDVHAPGVGSLLRLIERDGLTNVRIVSHDAVDVVNRMIAPCALAAVHVFFPDPWPKKRHHKRRLLQPAFVHALAERLAPDGYLHAATDWEDYAHEMLATLAQRALACQLGDGRSPRVPPTGRSPNSNAAGSLRGHGVWDLIFRRR